MLIIWLKFIICAAVVMFCGYKVCIYADKIAQTVKISRTFIGLMLLAVVTSLPELVVAVSATKIGALDLALGDLFGSNLFNLTIVGVIFLFFIKKPKLLNFDSIHFMSSGFSILLIALAAIGIVFYNFVNPNAGYSRILLDAGTALILLAYIFGAYLIFHSEKNKITDSPKNESSEKPNNRLVWLGFLFYSVILVGFAIYLSQLGDSISQMPFRGAALGGTFVGSLFMAVTTSLPELAVAISAVKLGFLDMALGNIFGSNMFNMLIISIADLSLGRKVILSCVSSMHLFTVFFVMISTGLVMASLVYRSRRKAPGLSWDSVSIIFVYFAANALNFFLR